MSNREIRRKLEEGGAVSEAKDALRRSFDRHSTERREQTEQQERIRSARIRRIWEDAANDNREEA